MSESQKKASKKWDDQNKEKKRYINARSTARGFIKNKAVLEDLEELEKLIKDKKKTYS